MPKFKRLTHWNGDEVVVNLDQIWSIARMPATVEVIGQSSARPERTRIRFSAEQSAFLDVLELPSRVVD